MNGRDLTLGILAGFAVAGLARQHGSRATDVTASPAFKRWFGASKVVDERSQPLRVYHGTNAHAYARGERIEAFGTSSRGGAFFSSDPRIAGQYGERVYAVYLRLENPLVVDAGGRGWTALDAASRIEGRITPPVRAALQEREERRRIEIAALFAEMVALGFDDLLADVEASSPASTPPMRRSIDARKDSLSGYTLGDLLLMDDNDSRETDDVAKSARTLGFDGVIFKNVQDSPTFDAGYSRFLSDIYAVFSPTQIKSATDNAGTFDPADPRINFNRRASGSGNAPERWYHLTDRAKFKLDPRHAPADNTISIQDRSGRPGIYLAPANGVEAWVNGKGYWRPFLVEVEVDPSVFADPGVHGRWGGERFIPAASFGKLRVARVIPLDAFAREKYEDYGWIETGAGTTFDTGSPIPAGYGSRLRGYRYEGPDVRAMTPEQIRDHKRRLRAFVKMRLG